MMTRRYAEAGKYAEQAIRLGPDQPQGYFLLTRNHLLWRGDVLGAREVLERMPEAIDVAGVCLYMSTLISRMEGHLQEALARLTASPIQAVQVQFWFYPKELLLADVCQAMGNVDRARVHYEAARGSLEDRIKRYPDDARLRGALGLVYAGLGRKQDAIREGRLGVELEPFSKDTMNGAPRLEELARIYVMVGEHGEAIQSLEHLLSVDAGIWMSRPMLRIDPRFRALRGHPRFERLLTPAWTPPRNPR